MGWVSLGCWLGTHGSVGKYTHKFITHKDTTDPMSDLVHLGHSRPLILHMLYIHHSEYSVPQKSGSYVSKVKMNLSSRSKIYPHLLDFYCQ